MPQRCQRRVKHHPRAGEAHEGADPVAHISLITLRSADTAKSFVIRMRTALNALHCIISQFLTTKTQRVRSGRVVFGIAIQPDHLPEYSFFSFLFLRQLRCHGCGMGFL